MTAITRRKNAVIPATIVGLPPMEDGFLGEAIGAQFTPVLRFQHRDVRSVFLPLETGFHNLAVVSSRQRYPRQARKTALGLLGAGQMMLLKTVMLIDEDEDPHDLNVFLDALNDRVDPSEDIIEIHGLPGDSLDPANPFENVQAKLIVDATSLPEADPRHGGNLPSELRRSILRNGERAWMFHRSASGFRVACPRTAWCITGKVAKKLHVGHNHANRRGSIPRDGMVEPNEKLAEKQRATINQITEAVWQLEGSENLRWLFITDDDLELHSKGSNRRLLWQLFARFDVERGLKWDTDRSRIAWDATAPIPAQNGELPARRWPAVTLHDPEILQRIQENAVEDGLAGREWPDNLLL